MKKYKLKVHDPDDYWSHVDHIDDDGNAHITIKEGELPIRPRTFTYEIVDEE
jgi:hypothetical protein